MIVPIIAFMTYKCGVKEDYNKNLNLLSLITISNANAEEGDEEYKVPCQINVKKGGEWNIRLCGDCAFVADGIYNNSDDSQCAPN